MTYSISSFHKNSDFLENSIKELETSLMENNLLINATNEEDKLEMSAKIGNILLKKTTFNAAKQYA